MIDNNVQHANLNTSKEVRKVTYYFSKEILIPRDHVIA